ncbi:MAG: glycoside hydrolase [Acidimicrobiales bacterium]|nr:glycoside hydrolase [Acidimicrobiales bacterium]
MWVDPYSTSTVNLKQGYAVSASAFVAGNASVTFDKNLATMTGNIIIPAVSLTCIEGDLYLVLDGLWSTAPSLHSSVTPFTDWWQRYFSVWKSTDDGATWTIIGGGPVRETTGGFSFGFRNHPSIITDFGGRWIVVAQRHGFLTLGWWLYYSDDGGVSWSYASSGDTSIDNQHTSVCSTVFDGKVWHMSSQAPVFGRREYSISVSSDGINYSEYEYETYGLGPTHLQRVNSLMTVADEPADRLYGVNVDATLGAAIWVSDTTSPSWSESSPTFTNVQTWSSCTFPNSWSPQVVEIDGYLIFHWWNRFLWGKTGGCCAEGFRYPVSWLDAVDSFRVLEWDQAWRRFVELMDWRDRSLEHHLEVNGCFFRFPYRWPDIVDEFRVSDPNAALRRVAELCDTRDKMLIDHLRSAGCDPQFPISWSEVHEITRRDVDMRVVLGDVLQAVMWRDRVFEDSVKGS